MRYSVSRLKTLFTCPYQYYKKYEAPAKEKADEKSTIARVLGTVVHDTIEGDSEKLSLEEVVQVFQTSFLQSLSDSDLMIKPRDSIPKAVKRGKQMITNYRKLLPRLVGQRKPKREWWLRYKLSGYDIVGKLDWVVDDRLYDFKTGQYDPRKEFLMHDIQFAFYRLGFQDNFGLDPQMFWVALDSGRIIPVELNEFYTDEALVEYLRYAERLIEMCNLSGFFPPIAKHGINIACNNCGYKHACVN